MVVKLGELGKEYLYFVLVVVYYTFSFSCLFGVVGGVYVGFLSWCLWVIC